MINDRTGRYIIEVERYRWRWVGTVGQPLSFKMVDKGSDISGAYKEIRFGWNGSQTLVAAIRLYEETPTVLLSLRTVEGGDPSSMVFPRFVEFPRALKHFSYRDTAFAPPVFTLEHNATPWLLFNVHNDAMIISAANGFMVAKMFGDGITEIARGLNSPMQRLPAGFTIRTLLTFGHGINNTWKTWGQALTLLSGKHRPANDNEPILRYLGYWTDAGSAYYYNYDQSLGYAGTLEAVADHYRRQEIPIRYLQLDSWWYSKSLTAADGSTGTTKNFQMPEGEWNRYGGTLKYEAHPAVFPRGLTAFQKQLNLPLVTHNRWIDRASPYRNEYRVSGVASIDRRWWDMVSNYLVASGVVTYEQDWLDQIYRYSPELSSTTDIGEAFMGNMAHAAEAKGLSIQYCMAQPRHFLESSRFDNVTSIRVSEDRFGRGRWDNFLYASRFAGAVGLWPWTDVFASSETDNLLLATLSGGVVGASDVMGCEDKDNLFNAVRSDGVIVKPDTPIVPLDDMYISDSVGTKRRPMVAWTYTDHGPLRTAYVFVYGRDRALGEASFIPSTFGFHGMVAIYNPRTQAISLQGSGSEFKVVVNKDATNFFEIVPLNKLHLAFFGDEGKFVSNGRARVADLHDEHGALRARINFAKDERDVVLIGYAAREPTVEVQSGSANIVSFDSHTGIFKIRVSPALEITPEQPGQDPVQSAEIMIRRQGIKSRRRIASHYLSTSE
jgi:hypothetical protein